MASAGATEAAGPGQSPGDRPKDLSDRSLGSPKREGWGAHTFAFDFKSNHGVAMEKNSNVSVIFRALFGI